MVLGFFCYLASIFPFERLICGDRIDQVVVVIKGYVFLPR